MTVLQQNPIEVRKFFQKTIPDQTHLTAIDPDKGRPTIGRDFRMDTEAACRWALERNADGYNVYFTVNLARDGVNSKPSKADIEGIRFGHVDIDPPKGVPSFTPEQREAAYERLKAASPSIIIWSGNGWQGLFRLDDGVTIDEVEQINRVLLKGLDGDKGTHDASRLLRVPGLINWPNEDKRRIGRVPALSRIVIEDLGTVSDVQMLLDRYPAPPPLDKTKAQPRDAVALRDVHLITADDLGLAPDHYLRSLIDAPKGKDRSADTLHFACEALRQGLASEQVMGVLLNGDNAISAHCLSQADPARAARRAIEEAQGEDDVARRQAQRERTRRIGEGSDVVPKSEIYSVPDMVERFVFIKDGSQVSDRWRPQSVLSLGDFRNATSGSKHMIVKPDGGLKQVQASEVWLGHADRLEADALTFRAGAGPMTELPDGPGAALNLWAPPVREDAPPNWENLASIFVGHVGWLWGEHADAFLDWLAHIEQQPGKLPHFGYLHISRIHGKGRNWISSVLARLWRGNVAASLDLMAVLDGGFNGRLSRCLLAVVDEINEGGNQSYRHAQTLRQIVTAEHREINPKYGRMRVEWNATRWLLFSNHTGAIPLGDDDRRFYVVDHDGPPRDAAYYKHLYDVLDEPDLIASVAEFLKRRDISRFNPGERPPTTAAKAALIKLNQSEEDALLQDLVMRWPVDVISASELNAYLGYNGVSSRSNRHAMDRHGIVKLRKVRTEFRTEAVYALRNDADWVAATPDALRAEIGGATDAMKGAALHDE
jgi:hypothetical protein